MSLLFWVQVNPPSCWSLSPCKLRAGMGNRGAAGLIPPRLPSHPSLSFQLPPSYWSLHMPAGLVRPPLQRVLSCWLLWGWLPTSLRVPEWCRLSQHNRQLHLRPRFHGKMGECPRERISFPHPWGASHGSSEVVCGQCKGTLMLPAPVEDFLHSLFPKPWTFPMCQAPFLLYPSTRYFGRMVVEV